jgi:hypothetical protein
MFPLARKSWEFPGAGWLGPGSYRQNRIRTRISWILSIGTREHLGITNILISGRFSRVANHLLRPQMQSLDAKVWNLETRLPVDPQSPRRVRDPATFLALPCCHSRWRWDMADMVIQKVWMQHTAGHGGAIGFRHTHFMALWIKHPISKYHVIPCCILMIPQLILPNQIPFYSIPLHPINIQSPNFSSHPSDFYRQVPRPRRPGNQTSRYGNGVWESGHHGQKPWLRRRILGEDGRILRWL